MCSNAFDFITNVCDCCHFFKYCVASIPSCLNALQPHDIHVLLFRVNNKLDVLALVVEHQRLYLCVYVMLLAIKLRICKMWKVSGPSAYVCAWTPLKNRKVSSVGWIHVKGLMKSISVEWLHMYVYQMTYWFLDVWTRALLRKGMIGCASLLGCVLFSA